MIISFEIDYRAALTKLLICSSELPFFGWDSYFLKEAIFFCMVGLPLFGKESSETLVFKILVRALD